MDISIRFNYFSRRNNTGKNKGLKESSESSKKKPIILDSTTSEEANAGHLRIYGCVLVIGGSLGKFQRILFSFLIDIW